MAEIKLNKRYKYGGDIFSKLIDIGFDIEIATSFLNDIEDADVVEVKHGEWIWTENGEEDYEQFWVCSVCKEKSYIETKFCSDCGAKMDKQTELTKLEHSSLCETETFKVGE